MPSAPDTRIERLAPCDVRRMHALLDVFGAAFEDVETYAAARPPDAYLERLLANETFFALVAEKDGAVVGGLTAYELVKFERARSEIYIYDLAVAAAHRRQGVATALIAALGRIATARGAFVMFVQADPQDAPAVALYSRLGRREDVLHFDIEPSGGRDGR